MEGPGGGVVEMPLLYALRFAQAGLLQGGWELSYPLTVGGVGVELGPEPGPGLGSKGLRMPCGLAWEQDFSPPAEKCARRAWRGRPLGVGGAAGAARAQPACWQRGDPCETVLLAGCLVPQSSHLLTLLPPGESRAAAQCSQCYRNGKVDCEAPSSEGGWHLDARRGSLDGAGIKGTRVRPLPEGWGVAQPGGSLRPCCPLRSGGGPTAEGRGLVQTWFLGDPALLLALCTP